MLAISVQSAVLQIDETVWAPALAPYVAAQISTVIGVQQVIVQPAASPVLPGGAYTAVPGFSISGTIGAGHKILINVIAQLNIDYAGPDIGRLTLARQIGTGPWVELTPAGCDARASMRVTSAQDEVRSLTINLLDNPGLTQPEVVTYQLLARSNWGNLWIGRRYDAPTSMPAPTTFTLTELA